LLEGTDEDAVAMTTLDCDERSPNGTTNVFEVTMDDDCAAAAAAGSVRLVHIHKNDDEPMVRPPLQLRSRVVHCQNANEKQFSEADLNTIYKIN